MSMSPRLLRPKAARLLADADASAYIAAVEQADQQSLEQAVKTAIVDFVVGCKTDGIWSSLKSACILMGARTLSGALTPLVGTAPVNNGPFVSGDYDRKTGLVGNSSTKYIDTSLATNAAPQNDAHYSVLVQSRPAQIATLIGAASSGSDRTLLRHALDTFVWFLQSGGFTQTYAGVGFMGATRSASASFVRRSGGSSDTVTATSAASNSLGITVLARRTGASTFDEYSGSRLQWYSLGTSLNLALLDTRVSALASAIGAASL